MRSPALLTLLAASFAPFASLASFACSDGGGEDICRVGADCASGVCRADGTCALVDGAADAAVDADPLAPDAPPADAVPGLDATPPACSPSGDDEITRAELPLQAGLHATFRVALDQAIDTDGTAGMAGRREWALDGALAGDHAMLLETLAVEGQWFASAFAGASYAARLSDESDLLGVFELTDDALLLRGVVSPSAGSTRTQLTYDPPATVLELPIAKGKTWTSTSTVTGLASGVSILATETYDSSADAHGRMVTPFGTFEHVVRVHVELTRTVGLLVTVKQTHAFTTECFGTIASLVSQDGELATEFTSAAEVRRLAP